MSVQLNRHERGHTDPCFPNLAATVLHPALRPPRSRDALTTVEPKYGACRVAA